MYERNDDYGYESINIIAVLELEAGQEVWVRPNSITTMYGADNTNGMYSWFSAHLVHAF